MNRNPFEYFICNYLNNTNTFFKQLYYLNNNFDFVLFKKYHTKNINIEAENGHLDVVKWLHVNKNRNCKQSGCTTDAMDYAAKYGHLDVVKWLHENRKEGCSSYAMNWAVRNGYLNVVKYLNENAFNKKTE